MKGAPRHALDEATRVLPTRGAHRFGVRAPVITEGIEAHGLHERTRKALVRGVQKNGEARVRTWGVVKACIGA